MRGLRWVVCWVGLAAVLLPSLAAAEDVVGRTGLSIEVGAMKLVGGQHDYSNIGNYGGLAIRRGLTSHWSYELALKYGWTRPGCFPGQDAGVTLGAVAPLYTVIWQPRVGLLWHPVPRAAIAPYLGFATGFTSWRTKFLDNDRPGIDPKGATVTGFDKDGNLTKLNATNFTGTLTLGFDVPASSKLLVSFGGRYHFFPNNSKDNVGFSDYHFGSGFDPLRIDANTGLLEAFAGVTILFGSNDRDHDGIPNNIDLCPDQPEDIDGFEDEDGCPDLDNDKDGILDVNDRCPNQPEDFDGFEDKDGCPDLDNDKDGIVDTHDKCPDDPEDFDNFQDEDGCPDPDNDGDGVLDIYDQCPDTPEGIEVDAKGCPIPPHQAPAAAPAPTAPVPRPQEIKQDLVLKGVTFVSGSAILTDSSKGVLREVARSLLAYPDARVEIRGYTDNIGSPQANRLISEARAMAVRDYLTRLGVMPSRLTAVGLGPDNPIASNDSAAGRAQNRRVELHRMDQAAEPPPAQPGRQPGGPRGKLEGE